MRSFLSVLLFAVSPTAFAQLAPGLVSPAAPPTAPAPANPLATATEIPPSVVPAPGPHSISLDVKLVRTGGASNMSQGSTVTGAGTTRATNTNSREREKETQSQLEVNLRNFAQRPDQVTVEWMFFSEFVYEQTTYGWRQEKENDPLRTLGTGSQEIAFKPGGSEKLNLESEKAALFESRSSTVTTTRASITSSDSGVGFSNSTLKIGHKTAGWLVRVKADGKILAFKASNPRLEKLAQDDAALAAIPPTQHTVTKGLMREDPPQGRR